MPRYSANRHSAKRFSWLGAGSARYRPVSHGLALGAALVALGLLDPAPAGATVVSENFQAYPVQNDAVGIVPDPSDPNPATGFLVTTTGATGGFPPPAPVVTFVCCGFDTPLTIAQANSAGIAVESGNQYLTVGSAAGMTFEGGDFDRFVSFALFPGSAASGAPPELFGGQIGPFFSVLRDLSNASFSLRVRAAGVAQGTEFRFHLLGPEDQQGNEPEIVTGRIPLTNAFQTFTVTRAAFTTNLDPLLGEFNFTQVAELQFDFFAADTTAPALEFHIDDVVIDTAPPLNTPPVATDDGYLMVGDTVLTVPALTGVLANDGDADGDPITAGSASVPGNGTVTLNADGGFTYTPNGGFVGPDSFTYLANDGTANSTPATVTITVAAPGPEALIVAEDFQAYPVQNDDVGITLPPDNLTTFSVTTSGLIGPSQTHVATIVEGLAAATGIEQDNSGNRMWTMSSSAGTAGLGWVFDRFLFVADIPPIPEDVGSPPVAGPVGTFFATPKNLEGAIIAVRARATSGAQGTEMRFLLNNRTGAEQEIATASFPLTDTFQTFTVTDADFTILLEGPTAFDFNRVGGLSLAFFAATTSAPALGFEVDDIQIYTPVGGAPMVRAMPWLSLLLGE